MTTISTSGPAVQLVEDVRAYGKAQAPLRPQAADAVCVTIAILEDEGYPGIELADGSVLVLSWAQMRSISAAFEQWAAIHVKDPAK